MVSPVLAGASYSENGIVYLISLIQGIKQMLLSKATYNKYICHKKGKKDITVGTVRMFIEPSAKHRQSLTHFPYTTKIVRIRCYITKYYEAE